MAASPLPHGSSKIGQDQDEAELPNYFILSAFIFIAGALLMMVASVWIAVVPTALKIAEEAPTSPTRVDRLVSGFIGSLGGCMAGLIAFIFIWGSYGRLSFAFVSFHTLLIAFTFFAYAYPNIVPEISLTVVDSVAQSIASIFG